MHYNIVNEQDFLSENNIHDKSLDDILGELEEGIDHNNYYWFQNSFSQAEIDRIIAENEPKTVEASTFSGADDSLRKSNITWIEKTQKAWSRDVEQTRPPWEEGGDMCLTIDNSWIFERFANMVQEANTNNFNFELWGMHEGIQYTVYKGGDKGFYCGHVDHGKNFYKRKISMVCQLSDPDSYSGGDLLIHTKNQPMTMPRGLGTVICFPSWMLHEVTPVLKGTRRSLVLWVSGPPFR
jgi:PKHD-type hydroxylase